MSNVVASLLMILIAAGLVAAVIAYSSRKGVSSLKIMLLGIGMTIFGGIIAIDPDSNLGGIEYLIVFVGFLISLVGFVKKD